MKRVLPPPPPLAPPFRAVPFVNPARRETARLTDRQREEIARISTRLRLPARMVIYHEGAAAEWVFAVAEGAVKCYRELPSGKRTIGAFLFERDLFGLAENGRYTNCAQAITRVVLYRIPVDTLLDLMRHDGRLQLNFLSKVTHELREAQRRAVLLDRRDALGRVAMFFATMSQHPGGDETGRTIPLPMTRSDMAAFLGLSLEAVSRAAAELERRGIVTFESRHLARIVDASKFAKLVAAV